MADQSKIIPTPHDRFFKLIFSDPNHAKEFLENTLESTLIQKANLNTLRLDNTSYIDEELGQYYSDVVYDCSYEAGSNLKVVFLLEHKSNVPDFPHIQILRYMLGIWEHNIKAGETLKPVVPIIFYHGKQTWKSKTFEQYFESGQIDGSLKPYVPQFDYWLSDMSQVALAELKQSYPSATLSIPLAAMKYIYDPKLKDKLKDIFADAQKLQETEIGKSLFRSIVLYLYKTKKVKVQQIQKVMKEIGLEDVAPIVGSTAWELMEEGKKEGIKEGEKERTIQIAKNSIKEGFANELIAKITGLSLEEIDRLGKEQL